MAIDWDYLRTALLRFGAAAVLASLAYTGADRLATEADARRRMYEDGLHTARARFAATEAARKEQADYGERFDAIRARGAIGAEDRLAWIEQIQSAAQAMDVGRLRYTLGSRAVHEAGMLYGVAGPVSASEMQLRMDLRHEGVLVDLIERVRDRARGIVWTRSCDLRRKAAPAAPDSLLEAECTLVWLTVSTEDEGDR